MGEFAGIALRRLPPAVFQADPVALEVLDELAGSAQAAKGAGDDPPGTG